MAHVWTFVQCEGRIGRKLRNYCERAQNIVGDFRYRTIASYLKELTIHDHHLTVEIFKCA